MQKYEALLKLNLELHLETLDFKYPIDNFFIDCLFCDSHDNIIKINLRLILQAVHIVHLFSSSTFSTSLEQNEDI